MKIRIILLLFLFIAMFTYSVEPYKNPKLSPEARALDIIKSMTLKEKVSQMMNSSPAIERLGIPQVDWWNEALHGVARAGKATVFPQTIGMAATFDLPAVYETYKIVSDEARAKHHDFKKNNSLRKYQGLTFWTPNINIFRDPRWGRGMETYGEDPFLTSQLGMAVVNGLQGDDAVYDKTHACAKHYAVHSGPEWNRHSYDAKNISSRDLWETYLPAFKSLVTEAGVKEVMCAYNRFEGEPCCSNKELLIKILRQEWKFNDIIVSDCGAINDFVGTQRHNTHLSLAAASADAVLSGTDICCGGEYAALVESVSKGLITESQIDQSLLRIFKARFELGMMDPDSLVSWSSIPYSVVESPEHVSKALEMAQKSMVLLKNNGSLPLSKKSRIAVLGPNANDSVMLWANYNGTPTKTVTILEGLRKKIGTSNVLYDKACDYVDDRVYQSMFQHCKYKDKAGFKATFWNTPDLSGTSVTEQIVQGPLRFSNGGNTVFAQGVNLTQFSARFVTTFTSPVDGEVLLRTSSDDGNRVFIDGTIRMDAWKYGSNNKREYLLNAEKGQSYEIVVEFFQLEKRANLSFNMDIVKTIDYQAMADKVKDCDAIVFVGGISPQLEGEEMSVSFKGFRGGDRTAIELPDVQLNMLKALKATGKPIIFVLCSGSAIAMPWEKENIDGILASWYSGQQGGQAVADVLFGDYNPAGRLPVTFYASTNDLPDFENYSMKGRTYRYFEGKALFPFGHGLSYTTFTYSKASLNRTSISTNDSVELRLTIKNTGKTDGDEVVQIYLRNLQDPEGPLKTLRHFQRISVPTGQSKDLVISLPSQRFESFDTETGRNKVKPGKYELLYGGTSEESALGCLKLTIK